MPLRPENYSFGAHHKAWWQCSKGHSYESTIIDRVRTMVKCPYCSGRKKRGRLIELVAE